VFRTVHTAMVIGLLFMLVGCEGQRQEKDIGEVRQPPHTADGAKEALLSMDLRQIGPGVLVPMPKNDPIEIDNADEISIGAYHCNLKERTFQVNAEYPNAHRHKFNRVSGVFELSAHGKWVAKVTEAVSGH